MLKDVGFDIDDSCRFPSFVENEFGDTAKDQEIVLGTLVLMNSRC